MKIITVVIVILGILTCCALWVFMSGVKSGQLPTGKAVADDMVYLMEMEKLLEQKSEQVDEPQLCNCCNTILIGGQCPKCFGSCDQTEKYKKPDYLDIPSTDLDRRLGGTDETHTDNQGDGSNSAARY